MKNLSKISLFLGLLTFVSLISCNQTKESVFKQKYHDLTAHYNAYFNAKEAYNIAYKNLLKNSTEDYTEILPLYAYGTPTDAKSYSGDFQRTIDKATIAIAEHEISKWSDNSYLLIGKSFYLQGDYNKAIETFQYITSEYQQGYKNEIMGKSSKSKGKKKKKKKGKRKKGKKKSSGSSNEVDETEYGLLEHIPSKYEALIWLSKSYVQQGKFKEAESILTYASTSPDFPSDMVIELNTAKAFVKLEKNDYSGSLASLQNLITASSKKKEKARYNFIIGQVYTEIGNYNDAQIAFENCLDNQPNYKMAFYAKLNNAKLARLNGRSSEVIRAQLNKMSKDGKNEEFLDQIYYELAEIAAENENFESATEYLIKSVRASVNNDLQKGKSFLRLGELHYDVEMYTKSKLYYDSAVVLLPTDMDGYDLISDRKEILTNLVEQLDIIATQDSLQKLASLSENELRKIINKKISEKMAEEKAANEELASRESGESSRSNEVNSALAFNAGKGSWYFYNSSALSKGFNAFQNKWGKRKLEDNWRRKDKSSFETEDDLIAEETREEEVEIDQSEYEKYLTNIPTDRQNMQASNDMIISALYTSAVIYKDDLANYKKAISQFEELLSRYPGNEFKLESYYNLYLIHQELGNGGKQETYKNKILAEFPASKIAKIISDPSYASAIQSEDDEVNDYYKKTYTLYQQGNYDEVIERNVQSKSQFRNNDLEPKFEFLAALSIGQKGQMPKFEEALINIVNKYPEDEVKSKAQEILMVLGGEELPEPVKEVKAEEPVAVNEEELSFEETTEETAMLDENLSEEEKMRKVFQDAIKNSKQESGGGFFGNVETDGDNSQDGFGGFGDISDPEVEDGDGGLFSFGGKEPATKPKSKDKSGSKEGGKSNPTKNNNSSNSKSNNNNNNQSNTGNTASNTGNTASNTGNTASNTGNTASNTGNTASNTGNTNIASNQVENDVPSNEKEAQTKEDPTPEETMIPEDQNDTEEPEEEIALNSETEEPAEDNTANEAIEEQVKEAATEEPIEEEEESFFGISDNAPHYYVLQVSVQQDLELIKKEIDRFNSANYNSLILRTTTMNLAGKKMLIAKKFKSAKAANIYRLALEEDPAFSKILKDVEHDSYSISVLNYAILLGNKDFSKYLEFHSENY
ncbi:MAG: tetratricopeptide repeat protein [Chitinophagales bacterium]|nr:tetratricopeptide repeat protein [Chitinophagales bacterium]